MQQAEPTAFGTVSEALVAAGFAPEKSEITPLPKSTVEVEDSEAIQRIVRLLTALDDLDDVQSTATNLEWTEAALAAAEQA